jgi:hypothetical protein
LRPQYEPRKMLKINTRTSKKAHSRPCARCGSATVWHRVSDRIIAIAPASASDS